MAEKEEYNTNNGVPANAMRADSRSNDADTLRRDSTNRWEPGLGAAEQVFPGNTAVVRHSELAIGHLRECLNVIAIRDRALRMHEHAQQFNFSCTAICRGVGHDHAARLTLSD